MHFIKRLYFCILALFSIILIGSIGYYYIEPNWTFLDAVYMTIITITSVGYSEIHPLSNTGRIFTIFIILSGMGVILYCISTVTAFFVEGKLKNVLRRNKMKKQIEKLKSHYIICGYGKIASHIAEELAEIKQPFVVIENTQNLIELLEKQENIMYLDGDPTDDDFLKEAGIQKAKGLIAALNNDKDNLFVVITARKLNPNLRIISRVIEQTSASKIKSAGADAVVSPDFIGGMRMISEMVRPHVVTFLDSMLRGHDMALRVEEAVISEDSSFANESLEEAKIPEKTGLIIVAVKDGQTGEYIYNPSASFLLKKEDVLIVLGDVKQVNKLRLYTEK